MDLKELKERAVLVGEGFKEAEEKEEVDKKRDGDEEMSDEDIKDIVFRK